MTTRTNWLAAALALGSIACPERKVPPPPPPEKSEAPVAPPPPTGTASLYPGPRTEPYVRVKARGTQSYTCTLVDGIPTWSPAVPDATLYEDRPDGGVVGRHFAGPTWEWAADESAFVGSTSADDGFVKVPSPDDPALDIPWLLVPRKTGSDAGVLGPALFVQRLHTKGGAVGNQPKACEAASVGLKVKIPYSTVYVFYRAGPDSEH